ncbi:hypothetical protein EHQ81_16230 [Leptospira selangorensis]|uniref:Uncharacterized protein n=1 Tax=Leptospira selangorensis TaxID=2484982 RepID=A0A4V3JBI6_9LEPT|nr:hypothetical protein [Leptospira selangorensis]TGK02389.1 hypothetical protein EHO58_17255 [Leptospira selangorensis]TGM11227.1 hypothetical protein EHQ81_16230 [Leptospira selangorensis]TGM23020.1 hypothetical protein EHQ82_06230 [Leptospira selangorensis]
MEAIGLVFVAGFVGTICMSLSMWSIHYAGSVNADMIRAVGSFFTKDMSRALVPGIITHIIVGLIFAFPYAFLISLAPHILIASIVTGGAVGFFHGYLVGFLLVVLVARNHPMEQFREAGISVAAAHVFGHLIYGVGIGVILGLYGYNWTSILTM